MIPFFLPTLLPSFPISMAPAVRREEEGEEGEEEEERSLLDGRKSANTEEVGFQEDVLKWQTLAFFLVILPVLAAHIILLRVVWDQQMQSDTILVGVSAFAAITVSRGIVRTCTNVFTCGAILVSASSTTMALFLRRAVVVFFEEVVRWLGVHISFATSDHDFWNAFSFGFGWGACGLVWSVAWVYMVGFLVGDETGCCGWLSSQVSTLLATFGYTPISLVLGSTVDALLVTRHIGMTALLVRYGFGWLFVNLFLQIASTGLSAWLEAKHIALWTLWEIVMRVTWFVGGVAAWKLL